MARTRFVALPAVSMPVVFTAAACMVAAASTVVGASMAVAVVSTVVVEAEVTAKNILMESLGGAHKRPAFFVPRIRSKDGSDQGHRLPCPFVTKARLTFGCTLS